MTDQTIPAGLTRDQAQAVREWAERSYAAEVQDETMYHAARVLLAVLPKRPTLADMSPEERAECRWMQADVKDRGGRYVIANPDDEEGDAGLVSADGEIEWMFPERVTPRPDLPRMEWPGTDQEAAPAPALPDGWRLADHEDYGRGIVTNPTPNHNGRVYFVTPTGGTMGNACDFCRPDELTYIDQGNDTSDAVPESTLAVGTVIESAADPRIAALPVGSILLDREGETVTKRCESWTGLGGAPYGHDGAEFGPWTVLHIPKEDDQ